MSMTAMQKLAERLRADQEKKSGKGDKKRGGDNASYPFWSINEGTSAQVRFLPDGDSTNPYFWANRESIKLSFDGQVGGDYETNQEVTVNVPCVDMFEPNTCPITAYIRPWWKQGPDKEALARKYYKKKSYIFQGFVISSPFEEPEVPENPIRRFVINPSIWKIINESMMNPEFEDMPTDYIGGREFTIRKTKQGEYANYGTSGWSFRTRALNDGEMAAIEQHGLHNLSEFLGQRPDTDGVAMIKAMFLDSLDGKPFDYTAYGAHYRAYGNRDQQDKARAGDPDALSHAPRATTSTASKPAARVAHEEAADAPETVEKSVTRASKASEPSEAAEAPADTSAKPNELLERIRKRTMTTAG